MTGVTPRMGIRPTMALNIPCALAVETSPFTLRWRGLDWGERGVLLRCLDRSSRTGLRCCRESNTPIHRPSRAARPAVGARRARGQPALVLAPRDAGHLRRRRRRRLAVLRVRPGPPARPG